MNIEPTTKHVLVTKKTHAPAHSIHSAAKEDHHQIFHLPDHDMHCVVAVKEVLYEGADSYIVLAAECWEVDSNGVETGLHAPLGTHSIPHTTVVDGVVTVQSVIDHMTAVMTERLAKRKKALASLDGHAVKRLSKEDQYRKPATPAGINEPHIV